MNPTRCEQNRIRENGIENGILLGMYRCFVIK